VIGDSTTLADANNPAYTIVQAAQRNWNDVNGDYVPQANELGPLSNAAFGTAIPATTYDPAILRGWDVRPYDWQASASITHEVRPGLGVAIGYFRTWFGNFTVTDNRLVTPADYDPYCITTPIDARLPGGGGQPLCGLYDIKPSAFGKVSNVVTAASNFGTQTEVYNGVEFVVNAKFARGGILNGGVSTATTKTNTCFVVNSPQQLYQCNQSAPWSAQTEFKLNGSYPLPWGLMTSGVLQVLPGYPKQATFVGATSTTVTNSLGYGGLLPPFTAFEDRLTQVDLRVTRTFRVGRTRIQPQIDVYNVFNGNTILGTNYAYGAAWLRPAQIMPARFWKFGAQVDF
jgi:hypothetical protein